jgi:hypothetical protein
MRESVEALWGWDGELQRRSFDERFTRERFQVIQVDGKDAGVLDVEERHDEVFLKLIELFPAYQGAGIGTSIIHSSRTAASPWPCAC